MRKEQREALSLPLSLITKKDERAEERVEMCVLSISWWKNEGENMEKLWNKHAHTFNVNGGESSSLNLGGRDTGRGSLSFGRLVSRVKNGRGLLKYTFRVKITSFSLIHKNELERKIFPRFPWASWDLLFKLSETAVDKLHPTLLPFCHSCPTFPPHSPLFSNCLFAENREEDGEKNDDLAIADRSRFLFDPDGIYHKKRWWGKR